MASIEKRVNSKGSTFYRVKIRQRGHPAQSATFDRLTGARRWAQQTEAAIREGRHFKTTEAKRHTLTELWLVVTICEDAAVRSTLVAVTASLSFYLLHLRFAFRRRCAYGGHIPKLFSLLKFEEFLLNSIGFTHRCNRVSGDECVE